MKTNIRVKDVEGKLPIAKMREYFEQGVNTTPLLKENLPLDVTNKDGAFRYYTDTSTDLVWVGYALGIRFAERVIKAGGKL